MPALRTAAAQVRQRFGGYDILFAGAGVQAFKPLLKMGNADWRAQIDMNLTGTANTLRAFAPLLVERSGGRIIVTSSTKARRGTKFGAAYSASKWSILDLMNSVALELGAYAIMVNAVIPGLIDTPLTQRESRYAQALQGGGKELTGDEAKYEEQARKAMLAKTPLGVPYRANA